MKKKQIVKRNLAKCPCCKTYVTKSTLPVKEHYVNNRLEGERFLYDENGDLESTQVY